MFARKPNNIESITMYYFHKNGNREIIGEGLSFGEYAQIVLEYIEKEWEINNSKFKNGFKDKNTMLNHWESIVYSNGAINWKLSKGTIKTKII